MRTKIAIRTDSLKSLYQEKLAENRELTKTELTLITQFAKQNAPRQELGNIVQSIININKTIERVEEIKTTFQNQRESFLESGIKEESLEKAKARLDAALDIIASENNYRNLGKISKKIGLLCDEVQGSLEREAAVRIATQIVRQDLSGAFATKFGKEASRQLNISAVHYLADNIHGLSNPQEIIEIAEKLKGLDQDKLNAVFDRQISLISALSSGQSGKEETGEIFKHTETDKEILGNQNQSLSEQLEDLLGFLISLDLNPKNITDENKGKLHEVINRLVRIGLGHPNAMRVLEDDYPNLLQKVNKLQEQIVQLQGREGTELRY